MSAFDAPMNPTGRDLRLRLEIRATSPGDAWLSRLIEQAVREQSEGKQGVGRTIYVRDDDGEVVLEVTGYAQTWDGQTAEELAP